MANVVTRRVVMNKEFKTGRIFPVYQDLITIDTTGDFNFFAATAAAGTFTAPATQPTGSHVVIIDVEHLDDVAAIVKFKDSISDVSASMNYSANNGRGGLFESIKLGRNAGAIINTNSTALTVRVSYYVTDVDVS